MEVTDPVGWLDQFAEQCRLSKSQLKKAMAAGAVWLQRAEIAGASQRARPLRRADSRVELGAAITLYYDEALITQKALQPRLVEDCVDFSVWDKPSGMLVSGSHWGDHLALIRNVEQALSGRTTQLIHRLDRWTSGLIVVAHNKKTSAAIAAQFADRNVYKRYAALVVGQPQCDLPCIIDSPLDGKPAFSRIVSIAKPQCLVNAGSDCVAELGDKTQTALLSVEIETGRTHQIRRHLADLGFPVVGDRRYGKGGVSAGGVTLASEDENDNRLAQHEFAPNLQLRAVELGFNYKERAYRWRLDGAQEAPVAED